MANEIQPIAEIPEQQIPQEEIITETEVSEPIVAPEPPNKSILKSKDGRLFSFKQLIDNNYTPERIQSGIDKQSLTVVGDITDNDQQYKSSDGRMFTYKDLVGAGYDADRIDNGIANGKLSIVEKKSPSPSSLMPTNGSQAGVSPSTTTIQETAVEVGGPGPEPEPSLVDWLASKRLPYDKQSRQKLAELYKIQGYDFSEAKNKELLDYAKTDYELGGNVKQLNYTNDDQGLTKYAQDNGLQYDGSLQSKKQLLADAKTKVGSTKDIQDLVSYAMTFGNLDVSDFSSPESKQKLTDVLGKEAQSLGIQNFNIQDPKSLADLAEGVRTKTNKIEGLYENMQYIKPVSVPTSITEVVETIGLPSDMQSRAKLAVQKGVVQNEAEYVGNGIQNTKLINALKPQYFKIKFAKNLQDVANTVGVKNFDPSNMGSLNDLSSKINQKVGGIKEQYTVFNKEKGDYEKNGRPMGWDFDTYIKFKYNKNKFSQPNLERGYEYRPTKNGVVKFKISEEEQKKYDTMPYLGAMNPTQQKENAKQMGVPLSTYQGIQLAALKGDYTAFADLPQFQKYLKPSRSVMIKSTEFTDEGKKEINSFISDPGNYLRIQKEKGLVNEAEIKNQADEYNRKFKGAVFAQMLSTLPPGEAESSGFAGISKILNPETAQNFAEYLWNNAWAGATQVAGGLYGVIGEDLPSAILDIFTDHKTDRSVSNFLKNDLRESLTFNLRGYDKVFANDYILSAAGAVANMLPAALINPSGVPVGFVALGYAGGMDAINSTPEGQKLPEYQKMVFAYSNGIMQGVIAKMGIDKIFGNASNKLAINTTLNTIKKAEANNIVLTPLTFEKLATAELNSIKTKALSLAGHMGTGATFGLAMSANDKLLKKLMNESLGKDVFELPSMKLPTKFNDIFNAKAYGEGWGEMLAEVRQGALMGGIGASIPMLFSKKQSELKTKIMQADTPEALNKLREQINDKALGNITLDQRETLNKIIDEYSTYNSKIPLSIINIPTRVRIADNLKRRDGLVDELNELMKKKETEDPAFQEGLNEQINGVQRLIEDINKEISDIYSGKKKEPVIVTQETQDLVQATDLPTEMTPEVVKVAEDNGITVDENTTPQDVVNEVKNKIGDSTPIVLESVDSKIKNFESTIADAQRRLKENPEDTQATQDLAQAQIELDQIKRDPVRYFEAQKERTINDLQDQLEAGADPQMLQIEAVAKNFDELIEDAKKYAKENPIGDEAVVEVKTEAKKGTGAIEEIEYNEFIDKGIVSKERLDNIAEKVKNREELSDRERQIFADKTAEINKIIAEKAKAETEVKTETTNQKEIDRLRAEEQAELDSRIPNAEQYRVDGKVDRSKLTKPEDIKAFDEVYAKYDKLISPLLEKAEVPKTEAKPEAPTAEKPIEEELPFGEVEKVEQKEEKVDKDVKKRALAIEAEDPLTVVLQYFISGGKINPSALRELFGRKAGAEAVFGKKKITGEHKARLNMQDNSAPSIKELAHQLWENQSESFQERFTDQDFRNAIEDAITSHSSPKSMAEEVMRPYLELEAAFERQFAPEEMDMLGDNAAQRLREEVENMPEDVQAEMLAILEKFQNEDGSIDWAKLDNEYKFGFTPELLNISPKAEQILNETINKVNREAEAAISGIPGESRGFQEKTTEPTAEPTAKPEEVTPTEAKSSLEQAKEAMRAAKEKLDAMRKNLGIIKDPKKEAQALYDYHKALVGVAKEYVKLGVKTVEDWAKQIGENVDAALTYAWNEATGKVKESEQYEDVPYIKASYEKSRLESERAGAEGGGGEPPIATSNPDLYSPNGGKRKAALKRNVMEAEGIPSSLKDKIADNLNYEVSSNLEAEQVAKALVDQLGDQDARVVAGDRDMHPSVRSAIFAELINRAAERERNATTTEAKMEAAEQWADLVNDYSAELTGAGQFTSYAGHFYRTSPLGFLLRENQLTNERFNEWAKDKNVDEIYDALMQMEGGPEKIGAEVEKLRKEERKADRAKRDKKIDDFFDSMKLKGGTYAVVIPPDVWNRAVDLMKAAVKGGDRVVDAVKQATEYISSQIGDNWDKEKFKNDYESALSRVADEGKKERTEEDVIRGYEAKMKELQRRIDEGDFSAEEYKGKRTLSDKEQAAKEEYERVKAEYDEAKKKSPEYQKKKAEQFLNEFQRRAKGIDKEKLKEIVRRSVLKISESGGLQREEFRKIVADVMGFKDLTNDQVSKIEKLTDIINAVGPLEDAMVNNPTKENIEKLRQARKEAAVAEVELINMVHRKADFKNTFASIWKGSLMSLFTLLKNPIQNEAFQAGVRLPVAFVKQAVEAGVFGVTKGLRGIGIKVPEYTPTTNLAIAQKYFFLGKKEGAKRGLLKFRTGHQGGDYFGTTSYQSSLSPRQAKIDWKLWKSGEKFMTTKEAIDTWIRKSWPSRQADLILRSLGFGDMPARVGAQWGRGAQIAWQELGLREDAQIQAFIESPKKYAYKVLREGGMDEVKAAAKAEEMQNRIMEEGSRAVMEQENILTQAIAGIKSGEKIRESLPASILATTTFPFLKIYSNVMWTGFKLAFPEVSMAQSAYYAREAYLSNKKGDVKKAKEYIEKSKDAASYAAVGAGFRYIAAPYLQQNNLVRSSMSSDEKRRAAQGERFYGKMNQINLGKMLGGDDFWVDLSYWGPLGATMDMATKENEREVREGLKGKEQGSWIAERLEDIQEEGLELLNMLALNNGAQTLNAFTSTDKGTAYGISLMNGLGNVMTGGTYAAISKAMLPYEVDNKADKFFNEALNNQKSRNILLRMYAGMPPSRVSIWGEPIKRDVSATGVIYSLLGVEKDSENKFGGPLFNDYQRTQDARFFPTPVNNKLEVNGREVELPQEKLSELQTFVGQDRKLLIGSFIYGQTTLQVSEIAFKEDVKNNPRYKNVDAGKYLNTVKQKLADYATKYGISKFDWTRYSSQDELLAKANPIDKKEIQALFEDKSVFIVKKVPKTYSQMNDEQRANACDLIYDFGLKTGMKKFQELNPEYTTMTPSGLDRKIQASKANVNEINRRVFNKNIKQALSEAELQSLTNYVEMPQSQQKVTQDANVEATEMPETSPEVILFPDEGD